MTFSDKPRFRNRDLIRKVKEKWWYWPIRPYWNPSKIFLRDKRYILRSVLRIKISLHGAEMTLMKKIQEHCDIDAMISALDLPASGSNHGYKSEKIIKDFFVNVWCGANRFMHTEFTRQAAVIRKIFGWSRISGQNTYKRFFIIKFTQEKNQQIFIIMYQWFFQNLRFDNYALDLDSSVVTHYGDQEGARFGYNTKKPGRKSHHSLMTSITVCRMIANVRLWSSNAHSADNLRRHTE